MRHIRVLIVDDHALFAEALSARLAREPDLVLLPVAADVRRALALTATERPDVLVLDLTLGAENGLDVLDRVRERHPEVRVVVLTATDGVDAMVRAVRRGAVGWLPKTESAELVARVIRSSARRGGWIPRTCSARCCAGCWPRARSRAAAPGCSPSSPRANARCSSAWWTG